MARDEEGKCEELCVLEVKRRKHVREGVGNPVECCWKIEKEEDLTCSLRIHKVKVVGDPRVWSSRASSTLE